VTRGHADASYLLDSAGPAAPPRDNGELVFAAPWESRAFGVALALHEAGYIDWEDFRQALIGEIRDWEAAHPSGEGWSYYECWLRSLERVVSGKGLVAAGDLQARQVAAGGPARRSRPRRGRERPAPRHHGQHGHH
jgi:nitrile hydratase accessory protein